MGPHEWRDAHHTSLSKGSPQTQRGDDYASHFIFRITRFLRT